jgi:outer membrane protein insertion porin family
MLITRYYFRFLLFILISLFFCGKVNSQDYYPGTPSSSYNSDYYFPGLKINKKKITVKNTAKENYKSSPKQIFVQGNLRLDSGVIIRDSKIKEFKVTNQKALSAAVKNLYSTGYYQDVKISKTGNKVFIKIIENPIINKIAFEGNSEIKDDMLADEVSLKVRNVFSVDKIKNDVMKIQNLYKRLGFFSVSIDPKKIKLDENRINLVFEINEGLEAKIKKINFLGNKEFSDSILKDVIYSKESRWYKFWSSGDKFDNDRINYDKDLLKKYYFDNGYIDFRTLSTTSQLVSTSKNFIINFKLYEGKRYKVTKVSLESKIKGFNNIKTDKLIKQEKDDWFSSKKLERSIDNLVKKASEFGFAFVNIRPKLKKVGKNNVEVTFVVSEGQKFYVERINITGNLKTHDKVIRREVELVEGDAFNLSKLDQTERNLKSLGLFESITLNYDEVPGTNKTIVDLEITERSTGEFSVGAGFSSLDGAIGNVGIKESNLFGEAKELGLTLGLATRKSSIDLSYTEPYFMDKDIAAGFDLFNIRRDNKTYSGYKQNSVGFKLRTGYEIFDDFRHFSSYTLKRDKIHDIDPSTSRFIQAQEGKYTTSMLGQAFQYDKLNDRLNPTDGYRIRFDMDFYGLGGDTKHLQTEFKAMSFYKVFEDIIASNFLEIGYIMPINDVKINNRIFLSGDQIRGFKNHGIGPRDSISGDALGGEQYIVLRNEITLPLGLPEELGVNGLIFIDAGTLTKTSEAGETVQDEVKLRASTGLGFSWLSPFGPVKFYLSKALIKENYDKTEIFRFSFGTTY